MSDCDNDESDGRLQQLNNWQTEQQKKLKIFQEAERKLLNSEHVKLLTSLKTQNYEQRHAMYEKDPQRTTMGTLENDSEFQNKSSIQNQIFSCDFDAIKLKDPKISLCSISQYKKSAKSDDFENKCEDFEESETWKPKKFLRKGEGLARFRMTIDDVKLTPNNCRKRTYSWRKPEFNKKKQQIGTMKAATDGVKRKPIAACKSKSVPVIIYVSDNKSKKPQPHKNASDAKVTEKPCTKNKELPVIKAPARTLTLKPVLPSNYTRGTSDRAKREGAGDRSVEKSTIEKEIRKDEKELEMFEMLEGKIGEGSLSPNSSLVARFMEQSFCSTPSKSVNDDEENSVVQCYMQKLRALQRRYLTPEQIERIKESNEEFSDVENAKNYDLVCEKLSEVSDSNLTGLDIIDEDKINDIPDRELDELELSSKSDDGEKNCCMELAEERSHSVTALLPESKKASKTLIQEYIANFKKLKNLLQEGYQCDKEDINETNPGENSLDDINDQVLSQREIAIKLQRKALQDNVKTLLNWEGPSRKKKKNAKKIKEIHTKPEKAKKVEKNDTDGFVNNELIKERMAELEKEIEIFQRENKTLNQLQKEIETEKGRLEKERKEFEKYMEQEKEKFEAKMNEGQKKLQRDKNVFEKYTKQVRNQPNKKEREEIANLKKEVEKLTESLTTKEARWGASQARLRNQIKSLEKENEELKSELEKLKKQNSRKVTFQNEKNLNTKIIHAINSELGKLRPHLLKSGTYMKTYQSQTARVDTNLHKPMRRIKSVPNLKNHSDKDDVLEEENRTAMPEPNKMENKLCYIAKESKKSEISKASRSGSLLEKSTDSTEALSKNNDLSTECRASREEDVPESYEETEYNSPKDFMESVLREAYFELGDLGDHNRTNGKVAQIKKRLEKLNLLHHSEPCGELGDKNRSNPDERSDSSSEESYDRINFDGENFTNSGRLGVNEIEESWEEKTRYLKCSPTCTSYHCQPKIDSDGIRRKVHEDGRKEIYYPNGNIKKISADKRIVKMLYYNGDLKETDLADGNEKYYYAETGTWHTTYRDGLEVLEFPNGQTERRHPDGSTEIHFPNGCIRYCDSTGKDEWRFPDDTIIKTDEKGHKVLLLPNGQKEIHTDEYKRREFPDGTVKVVYADGSQETRYASGRVRLRDKDGNLVMDSGGI